MIYCHSWEQIGDGGMLAVKMSKDWSARIGDPITLFHASQAPWVRPHPKPDTFVTDGPFLHWMKNGKLVMIWSSFVKGTATESGRRFRRAERWPDLGVMWKNHSWAVRARTVATG